MKILDFLALALKAGDKVHIKFNYTTPYEEKECDAVFAGFRHYGKGLIHDFLDIFPVFYEVGENGKSTQRLLHGVPSWDAESFQSIQRITPLRMAPEAVSAIYDLRTRINSAAYKMILELMESYVKIHPGRPKILLDPDDGVSVMLSNKYCSYTGIIVGVSFKDGKIRYDISTQRDFKEDILDFRDAPRCGAYVEDETYLLKVLNSTMLEPYFPDDEKFFDYIKPGAVLRWNDDLQCMNKLGKPGPKVRVLAVTGNDRVITPETIVKVYTFQDGQEDDGMEVTVNAGELEPLEP